jgi:hypothetical protein
MNGSDGKGCVVMLICVACVLDLSYLSRGIVTVNDCLSAQRTREMMKFSAV